MGDGEGRHRVSGSGRSSGASGSGRSSAASGSGQSSAASGSAAGQAARAAETRSDEETDLRDLADHLHSSAIDLLRRLRKEDDATGLSAPRLSALSVIVYRGPISIGALADAEQVRPPTISRLVKELEWSGLVTKERHDIDRRVQSVRATPRGRRVLEAGRERRVAALAERLAALTARDRRTLSRAADLIERVARDG